MVLSATARAAAKIAKIAKAKRALVPAKTRALKPRDRRVKKASKTGKLKKHGKKTTVHLTTVGKSNTSVAAKKAAAIKQIKNMNVDRNQGIIIGIKGTLPRQPDKMQTWGVASSPTLPNAKALKIASAIEYVKKTKIKKGQNIIIKKAYNADHLTKRKSYEQRWNESKMLSREKFLSPPGTTVRRLATRGRTDSFPDESMFTTWTRDRKIPSFGPKGFKEVFGKPKYLPPRINIPTKKAPRTVAGMDKYAWGAAGAAGGMGATGYAVGKYDKEIGEHVKGNIKGHVKTADTAIDVIKERRDQLLRKLGLI